MVAGCSGAPAAAPPTTAPPVTATTAPPAVGTDEAVFCAALDAVFPLVLVLGADAERATPPVGEVALAPVLAPTLTDLARTAPTELADPFTAWAERNRLALAAFTEVETDAGRTAEYVAAVERELAAAESGQGDETAFADLAGLAEEFGVDRPALTAVAGRFVATHGTFGEFSRRLGASVILDPATEAALGARYPCLAPAADEG